MGEMIVASGYSELYDPVWVEQRIKCSMQIKRDLFEFDVRPLQGRKIGLFAFSTII